MNAVPYDPDIRQRRSIRLWGFDYASAGAYFVTICTYERRILLTNPLVRNLVYNAWHDLPRRFPSLRLDEFVIMPNHVHFIIWITDVGAQRDAKSRQIPSCDAIANTTSVAPLYHAAPLRPAVAPRSLGAIVRAFKSVSAKRINRLCCTPGAPVLQSNYYERIIRNEEELSAIRQYIRDNPAK